MLRILLIPFFVLTLLQASNSYLNKALKKAKEEKKLLLIEISKQNCIYCKALDREVFQNPKNLKEIKKEYVILRLQREKDSIPSFLKVKFYPTTYILNPKGSIIDEIPGYIKSKDFIDFIKEVYKQEKRFL